MEERVNQKKSGHVEEAPFDYPCFDFNSKDYIKRED